MHPTRSMRSHIHIHILCALCALALCASAGCKPADAPKSGSSEPSSAGPIHAPKLTPDKMPPGFEALALGVSDEAAITKLLGQPSEREADTSLGGDMSVRRNDIPAINLTWKSEASLRRELIRREIPEAAHADAIKNLTHRLPTEGPLARYIELSITLTPAAKDQPPTLHSLWLRATSPADTPRLCAHLAATLGQDPEATRCPGTNRTFGQSPGGSSYCAGDADGQRNVFIECRPGEGANADTDTLEIVLAR